MDYGGYGEYRDFDYSDYFFDDEEDFGNGDLFDYTGIGLTQEQLLAL
jgi:hypothetical protein